MYTVEDYINTFNIKDALINEKIQTEKLKAFNGHLYKYYSTENAHTLSNIKDNIIYFSKPETFNDPFDCCWGYDEEKFISELLIAAIIDSPLKDFHIEIDILCKIILNEYVNKDEISLLENTFNKQFTSNVSFKDLIVCDFKRKAEKILTYVTTDHGDNMKEFFEACSNVTDYQSKLNKAINIAYGISCFSERYDNALMWSHYANRHTGICVEYDFSLFKPNEKPLLQLFPVIYTNKRECLPTNVTYDENWKPYLSNSPFTLYQIIKNLISKSDVWNYEQEWRLIGFFKELTEQKWHLPIISKIYLGVNFDCEYNLKQNMKEKIVKLAIEKSIPVFQVYLSTATYEMKIKRIF